MDYTKKIIIQAFVKEYIDKYLKIGTGIISRFIYALLITAFAVFITYQLSKLNEKFAEEKK